MPPRPELPLIEVPYAWLALHSATQKPNTRWYVDAGYEVSFHEWLQELHEAMANINAGLLIPMQWVPEVVGVSRAAVHKRANRGGLTVFSYVALEDSYLVGHEGKLTPVRQYDLVPFVECTAWRNILAEIRQARAEFDDIEEELNALEEPEE